MPQPVLFMLMGLPGAGKTTFDEQLAARRPAILLSPDVWMTRIVGDGHDAARRAAVKAVQSDLAARLLRLGCDVILEFGFFARAERDAARGLAHDAGAQAHLVFLDPPMAEILRRLAARNAALPPDSFAVSPQHLALCAGWLERPGPDEPLWSADPSGAADQPPDAGR